MDLKGFVVFCWVLYSCFMGNPILLFYFISCSTFYLSILWRLIDWYESRICRSVLHLHWVCSTLVNLA